MTTAVKVYKNNIFLGDATATVGSATLASYSGAAVGGNRNVGVTAVAGADAGQGAGAAAEGGGVVTLRCYRCCAWPCVCADGCTIIHGDCLDVLPTLNDSSVDAVITDPPFSAPVVSHMSSDAGHQRSWGDLAVMEPFFREVMRAVYPANIWFPYFSTP